MTHTNEPTNYHRWTSLNGTPMLAIDVRAYKKHRARKSIRQSLRNIFNRLTLSNSATSMYAAAAALPALTAAAYV